MAHVWMYYRTDGDSGYYAIKLFATEAGAHAHAKREGSPYGNVTRIEVER